MKILRIFSLIVFSLAVSFLAPSKGQAALEKKAPIITSSFAVEKGYYGYIWKIYVEAEDPEGDMLKIASVVDEVGYGHYPTDWIYLRPQYQKHFKGYIQWNTFSSTTPYLTEWTQIALKVSVFDKAGNESNVVVFPFTFEVGKDQYRYKLPGPFDQGDLPRLGYIHINLFDPILGHGGGRDN
jgi:hypothetical protein